MSEKFWKWSKNEETGERILRLDGVIRDWDWVDELFGKNDGSLNTPKEFREELNSASGDIVLELYSSGGNVFAAAEIYAMLKEYKGGKITVQIAAWAASAATIIAMAGDTVEISPLAMMCIHNPFLDWASGEEKDLLKAAEYLANLKENIINAYELKTKLPRQQISEMMDEETYLTARKAIELHFADKLMFEENEIGIEEKSAEMFSSRQVSNSLIRRLKQNNTGSAKRVKNNRCPALSCYIDLLSKIKRSDSK